MSGGDAALPDAGRGEGLRTPANDRSIDQAGYESLARLHAYVRRFPGLTGDAVAETGLTDGHYQAMVAIRAHAPIGRMVSVELAEQLGISAGRAAEQVGRLVEGGLVERAAAPVDHRRAELALTAAGLDLLARLAALQFEQHRRLLAELGRIVADPGEILPATSSAS